MQFNEKKTSIDMQKHLTLQIAVYSHSSILLHINLIFLNLTNIWSISSKFYSLCILIKYKLFKIIPMPTSGHIRLIQHTKNILFPIFKIGQSIKATFLCIV